MNYLTNKLFFLLSIVLLATTTALAQTGNRLTYSAGIQKGRTIDGVRYDILESKPGKPVTLRQGKAVMTCNQATVNSKTEDFVGIGNVVVKTADGVKITGYKIDYDKTSGRVIITGKEVRMTQDGTLLITDKLNYNMNTGSAFYTTGGEVFEKTTYLKSKNGFLDNETKTIAFQEEVLMRDTVKNQEMVTDSLTYNTEAKIARFYTRTKIETADGTIESDEGIFNDLEQSSTFVGNVVVEDSATIVRCDTLVDSKAMAFTLAKGKVTFLDKKEAVKIISDEMQYEAETGKTKAYGRALMTRPINNNDDLFYLAADTLESLSNNGSREEVTLFAYPDVKIFSKDLSGKCDSLVYDYADSLIYFYEEPILWSQNSQLTGKTIVGKMGDGNIETLTLQEEGYIISEDTLGNFNQIKGKEIISKFEQNNLKQVDVDGNGELIYFVLAEGGKGLTGMNRVSSSHITMYFIENNQLEVLDVNKADSKIIPATEILEPDTRLPGFKNRFSQKPSLFLMQFRMNRLEPKKSKS